jgi:hypothetical protein
VTTASVAAADTPAAGDHTVTLTATDNLSGVAQTLYEVDGGKPQMYSGPFALNGDVEQTVTFWSVDKAGNVEDAQTITVPKSTAGPTGTGGGTGVGGSNPPHQITSVASSPIIVSLKRYGFHMRPTVLVLKFSEALDPARAQDAKNYKVLSPSGRTIHIARAVYDPTDDTVTLSPKQRINIHHTYRLKVIGTADGGVMGDDGILLDGAGDGFPGTDYVAKLTWKNLVLTAAQERKYHRQLMQLERPAGPLAHRFIGDPKSHLLRRHSTKNGTQRTPI